MIPAVAITMGDPAGIGPELAVRVAADACRRDLCRPLIFGNPETILRAARAFTPEFRPEIAAVPGTGTPAAIVGRPDPACGRAAYETVCAATRAALAGEVAALVTAPMNKYAVNLAGIPFTGHTELIAGMCGVSDYAMMQSSGSLRVAFVTTHIALAEVPCAVTFERIVRVGGLLRDAVCAEGVARPKLAAAALNPHAGENGCMGGEDEAVVKPALAELNRLGIDCDGPFPPDTLFIRRTLERYDGILSMYHDQGHIPFKMLAFESGVNSTLGLPIIRTSPDHGTAFDIAWQGVADVGSFSAALELAVRRARNRGCVC